MRSLEAGKAKATESHAADSSLKDSVQKQFLVSLPDDFFSFWEFCKSLEPTSPSGSYLENISLKRNITVEPSLSGPSISNASYPMDIFHF